ncbi:serine protease inhibitor [Arthrobacter gandavensis]|uniref:serine protease inhibitor n=1 Tax=Arthrobacter gandavensis TaxID=169960 RepID=UPI00188F7E8E|nr:serine protease inhibitor [Arthrobacter gandavensis]MBF4994782.1 serine protease inhibitor [Arthrobacter gandavensis]
MPNRLPRTLLALAAAALVLAGCADSNPGTAPSSSEPATPAASSAPAAPASPAAATSLGVELMADGEAVTDSWTLECDGANPAGDSGAPDPAAACAALADGGTGLFAEPGSDVACTMQYGGPQRAAVSGTVAGQAVDAEFAATDGCQISRWEALSGLLGPATRAM